MYLESFFGNDVGVPHPCSRCQTQDRLDFEVSMAFQPIVDASTRSVYAYEALVRGAARRARAPRPSSGACAPASCTGSTRPAGSRRSKPRHASA